MLPSVPKLPRKNADFRESTLSEGELIRPTERTKGGNPDPLDRLGETQASGAALLSALLPRTVPTTSKEVAQLFPHITVSGT